MPARRLANNVRALHGGRVKQAPLAPDISENPEPPQWLSRSGKKEWRRVVKLCTNYDSWLQGVDRAALTGYCLEFGILEEAGKDIVKRGSLVPGRSSADKASKTLVKIPSVQIAREAGRSLRQWCSVLGFVPDARNRIDIARLPSSAFQDDSDLD